MCGPGQDSDISFGFWLRKPLGWTQLGEWLLYFMQFAKVVVNMVEVKEARHLPEL